MFNLPVNLRVVWPGFLGGEDGASGPGGRFGPGLDRIAAYMIITGKELSWVLTCYVLGCFTTGYYWVRWRTGRDVRGEGSGNVGARNVGRVTGPSGFVVTLLLDVLKGGLAVVGARYFQMSPELQTASLIAVILGHNWPCQLRFHGGKGVAVSLGALLVYDWFVLVVLLVVFLPHWLFTRNFMVSGMLAYALAPLLVFMSGLSPLQTFAMSITSMLVVFAHRKNIREEVGVMLSDRTGKQSATRPPPEQRTS